jgi:hypothetical protein
MKKNEKVAKIKFSYGHIVDIEEIYNINLMPIGVLKENGKDLSNFYKEQQINRLEMWWKNNAIPTERDSIRKALECLNITSTEELKVIGKGLSLLNQYWIQETFENLRWEDLNYWDNPFSDEIGEALFNHKPIHKNINEIGKSPDNGVNGALKKRWISLNGEYFVQKDGTGLLKEEVFNEVLATMIMDKASILNANYRLNIENNNLTCISKCLTNKDTELIPLIQLLDLVPRKVIGYESEFEHTCNVLNYLGIKDGKKRLNEILCVDYILAGTDRHYNNIAVIYDTVNDTYSFSPVYDSGDCLWANKPTKLININDDTITARPFCNKSSLGTWEKQKEFITEYIKLKPEDLLEIVQTYIDYVKEYSEMSMERLEVLSNGILQRNYNLQQYLLQKNIDIPKEYLFSKDLLNYFNFVNREQLMK